MASDNALSRAAARTTDRQTQPERQPQRRYRPDLGVLDRKHVLERARRRQARALFVLAGLCLAVPLMMGALGHALVASSQVRADGIQNQISSALQTQQNLQLEKAELTAPSRVLNIAEQQLHMVTEPKVTYLVPVNPGKSVLQSHGPGSTALTDASSVKGSGASQRHATTTKTKS